MDAFAGESMRVVVPKETMPGECRVALVPETVGKLVKAGLSVVVEQGAGEAAGFTDAAYEKVGASIAPDARTLYAGADVVAKVQKPTEAEVELLPEGSFLVGVLQALVSPELVQLLAKRKVTSFALELVPRTTRAQSMDVLSSQATAVGYKAVLAAADAAPRFFPMLTTAAGTVRPSTVLVIGAGVAGLQAIATARRLGAVVQGFDIRPAAQEQVESLGAKWVGLTLEGAETAGGYAKEVTEEQKRQEHEHLAKLVAGADVVITTAQVPGRRAPVLITKDMVAAMHPGAVIVDVAAESGGNCELTRAGERVRAGGVLVIGPVNLPSGVAQDTSTMFSRNLAKIFELVIKDGALALDFEDEIVRGAVVTHEGRIVNEAVQAQVGAAV